jgi:hypothetical protein
MIVSVDPAHLVERCLEPTRRTLVVEEKGAGVAAASQDQRRWPRLREQLRVDGNLRTREVRLRSIA